MSENKNWVPVFRDLKHTGYIRKGFNTYFKISQTYNLGLCYQSVKLDANHDKYLIKNPSNVQTVFKIL